MTAASVLTPTVVTRSWKTMQRIATVVFVIVLFSVLAFAAGRASVHARHTSPPAVSSVSGSESAGGADRCLLRSRPC